MAQQIYDRMKRQKDITALLQFAVEQVRAMTGFDRDVVFSVMLPIRSAGEAALLLFSPAN